MTSIQLAHRHALAGAWTLVSRVRHRGAAAAIALSAVLAACAQPAHSASNAAPVSRPTSTSAPGANARVAEPRLYVANQASATISVIDPLTDSLITTVDLQQAGFSAKAKPHDTAVEPDGSYWYVSLIGENAVVKFDRDNKVVGKATTDIPGLLALDPKSDLLYATRTMSAVNPPQRVAIIHRSTMKVDEVDVFIPRPHAIAVDPRGGFAYVGSLAENQIATINGNTEQVTLSRVPGDSLRMIVDFAASPDGTRLVGTDQMGNAAVVFDATTPTALRQIATIPVDPWPWHVAFTPDGKDVWFGNQRGNSVTDIDAATWKVAAVVKGNGLAEPHGIAISPDGRSVFVSNHNLQGTYTSTHPRPKGTGTVVVIDRAHHTISRVIETDSDPVGMSLTGRP